MAKQFPDDTSSAPGLNEISTRWPLIRDPIQFVLRYAPAIRKYLLALMRNTHDAEDVAQEFLLKGILRGFVRTEQLRGRFRDYLKTAVRNAALNYLQQHRPATLDAADLVWVPDPHDAATEAEAEWVAEWRGCVLDRALQALDSHERQSPDSLFYTAMRLALDHPEEDSTALAARASTATGRTIQAAAFRKQLSRARRRFAELVVDEVRQTLQQPTSERVEEELAELGLLEQLREFLPDLLE
jgi:RNA polymerase sigma-70 factor (ECF subfamily)